MISFIRKRLAKVTAPSLIARVGLSLLLLASCTSSNNFRLTGSFENLRQTDFYVYATDGSLAQLDTIHVIEGSFEWETPLADEATLHIVYPNLGEQVVFARPGDHVRIEGDANQLRAVSIEGNPENDAYTRFRLENLQASPDSLRRAMQAFIKANPESRVSNHLQRQLTLSRTTASRLRKGQKLPAILLPPDTLGGDTLRLLPEDSTARPVLLCFWATWKSDSRNAARDIREALRQSKKLPKRRQLQPISISLDFDSAQYAYSRRADSIDYDRRRYPQIWDAPICELLAIQHIPYYILTDTLRQVVALGTDWKTEIKPELDRLLK